jgi:hypothetical protein
MQEKIDPKMCVQASPLTGGKTAGAEEAAVAGRRNRDEPSLKPIKRVLVARFSLSMTPLPPPDVQPPFSPADRSKTAENEGFLFISGVSGACGCTEYRLTAKHELSSIIENTSSAWRVCGWRLDAA